MSGSDVGAWTRDANVSVRPHAANGCAVRGSRPTGTRALSGTWCSLSVCVAGWVVGRLGSAAGCSRALRRRGERVDGTGPRTDRAGRRVDDVREGRVVTGDRRVVTGDVRCVRRSGAQAVEREPHRGASMEVRASTTSIRIRFGVCVSVVCVSFMWHLLCGRRAVWRTAATSIKRVSDATRRRSATHVGVDSHRELAGSVPTWHS